LEKLVHKRSLGKGTKGREVEGKLNEREKEKELRPVCTYKGTKRGSSKGIKREELNERDYV
jgi:hypothetical protein